MRLHAIVYFSALTLASGAAADSVTNCAQHARLVTTRLPTTSQIPIDIRATISAINIDGCNSFAVQDDTGFANFRPKPPLRNLAQPGDHIRLLGYLKRNEFDETISYPTNIVVLSRGTPPEPVTVSIADLKSDKYESRLVRTTGVIRNIFTDELDPDFRFLLLMGDGDIAYVVLGKNQDIHLDSRQLIGKTASITGICSVNRHSLARQTFRRIPRSITCVTGGIAIHDTLADNGKDLPDLSEVTSLAPKDIPLELRYRTCGRVLATWDKNTVLLRAASGQIVRVRLATRNLPAVNDIIEAVGFPENNLFTCGLDSAFWNPSHVAMPPEPAPIPVSASSIMEDDRHMPKVSVYRHGQLLRLTGRICGVSGHADNNRFLLETDGYFILVDASADPSAFRSIPIGSIATVTGICVMDIDDWRPSAAFPRVRGFILVLRKPEDVQVISTPSWWTGERLLVILIALLTVLIGSFTLNIILKKLVARRERELKEEISARVSSECKVRERTRLSVELHDAIAQNLTGVALQLRTVATFADSIPATAKQHIAVAMRTLDSCRDELRYCLWDLRNNTLEQGDMNNTIRKTIAPHIGKTELIVRFNVPRAKLTDNTAHNVFHILRELASNSVRHGHATQLRIAGCLDGGMLRFSLADNGCGFDPENCAGIESGHFGLIGVRERIECLEGKIEIVSGSSGTKVAASIPTPADRDLKT